MDRRATQKDIAERLGLDRTTVAKILNRDPRYSASEETREKVFRMAEKLGYDFTTIRRPFKREYGRSDMDTAVEISILLDDDETFDSGKALVRNLSVGGALLTGISLARNVLPLQNFTIRVRFADHPDLADMVGECEVVRLAGSSQSGEPELGVRFINLTHRDRRRIREFVEAQGGGGPNPRQG